jgi:hypothetical protein
MSENRRKSELGRFGEVVVCEQLTRSSLMRAKGINSDIAHIIFFFASGALRFPHCSRI